MSTTAFSQPATSDALQFRVLAGMEHDDNVLRQPTGQVSDDVAMVGVGVKFDRKVGLQRFRADAEFDTYRYNDLSNLDYNTLNYNAAWDWSVTPSFHGVLSADRRQFREVTTDSVTGTNRIGRRTTREELFDAAYNIDGGWRALGGLQHTRSQSTDPNSWDASPDISSANVGVGYEFASGSTFSARYKRGDGEYTQLATPGPNDFKDTEYEFLMKWPVTGKTALDGRLAHIKREHAGAPLRDFSGLVGNLAMSWDITGKTRLIAAIGRDIGGTGQSFGGHVVSNRIYLSPVWHVTAKTSINARYEHTTRSWRDTPAGSPDAGRHETVELAAIGADWEAFRWLTVSTQLREERLKSSIVTTGYRATVFTVGLKAWF